MLLFCRRGRGHPACLALLALALCLLSPIYAQEAANGPETPAKQESAAAAVESEPVSDSPTAGRVTRDQLQQLLAQQPEPSKDQPATREYEALQSALDFLAQEKDWQGQTTAMNNANASVDDLDAKLTDAQNEAAELASKMLPTTESEAEVALKLVTPQIQELNDRIAQLDDSITNAPQRR